MKNNKKGFVFIETIITIVFLAAALLILYSSYRNAILEERKRIYYDDISYLYRNYYIADFLINKTEIHDLKDTAFEEKYAVEIDNNFKEKLFSEYQTELNYPEELDTIEKKFNVDKMMFVSEELITECFNAKENDKCEESYRGLSDGLAKYLETMEIDRKEDDNTTYYLVTEYREKSSEEGIEKCEQGEENCSAFYVTLKLDINKKIEVPDALIGEACRGQNFAQCLKDNYTIENDTEGGSGIYHHDGNGTDSGYGDYESGDDSYRYAGGNPNNYICFGSDEEECPEENLYRIIGVYGNNIKIIKEQDNKTGWNELNTRNINYSEKWNNMIENSSWNTAGISIDKISLNAKGVYGAEITGATKNSKTGLMYVNEYMYGASPKYWVEKGTEYSKAKDNNWLFTGNEWMLTSVQGVANQAYVVSTEGNVGSNLTSESITARGSAILKNTIILVGGIGTREQPFRITNNGAVVKDIELATEEPGYYDIEVNVVAESQEGSILKYYFSYKKHSDSTWSNWIEDDDKNHLFEGLESFTEYDIKAKVLNNRGIESEEYQKTFKTKYAGPSVTITGTTNGWFQIELKVQGVKGSVDMAKYCYNINDGSFTCENSSSLSFSHIFKNLNPNTTYKIGIKAFDKNGWESLETKYTNAKTDNPPTVTAPNLENGWYNANRYITANVTAGTGNYHIQYCDTTSSSCTPNKNGNSVYHSTEDSKTVCFNAKNDTTGELTKGVSCATSRLDKHAPTCSYSGNISGWVSSAYVSISCNDTGGSGCDPSYSGTSTYAYYSNPSLSTTIKDKAGNSTYCSKTWSINIDSTNPSCGRTDGNGSYGNWASYRTITQYCTDYGSGCRQNSYTKTFYSGTYDYIRIYDNVGNYSDCSVSPYVDSTPPSCSSTYGNGYSYDGATSRTITQYCSDSESGCKQNSYTKTFSSGYSGSITIYDNAGNYNYCTVYPYIDSNGPTCGSTSGEGSSYYWTNGSRTITQYCNDAESGCKQSSYTQTFSSEGRTGTITIYDRAGHSTNCTVDTYIDKTAPSVSVSTSGTTVTTTCTDSLSGINSCSSCSYSPCKETLSPGNGYTSSSWDNAWNKGVSSKYNVYGSSSGGGGTGGGKTNPCSPYKSCYCYCHEDTTYKTHTESYCAYDCNSACQYRGYANGSGSCS